MQDVGAEIDFILSLSFYLVYVSSPPLPRQALALGSSCWASPEIADLVAPRHWLLFWGVCKNEASKDKEIS